MRVVVFDYGAGNLHSLVKAIAASGVEPVIETDPVVAASAGVLVLPGVGAFEPAAVRHAPAFAMQAGTGWRAVVEIRGRAIDECRRDGAFDREHGRCVRRYDIDRQVRDDAAAGEHHERRRVRGNHDDPRERSHARNTTSTVNSSHATTHSVHATTLAVIPRVTESASGFGAPPLATTSLAIPHA